LNVLVVGDSCHDVNHYGRVNRISPEAPVPIFDFDHAITNQGMASNVAQNVQNLGQSVTCVTHFSSEKHRYIDERLNQQVIRVDVPLTAKRIDWQGAWAHDLDQFDLVLVSDYNKGFLTYEDIKKLRHMSQAPMFVDTKKPDLKQFAGCTLKINQSEWASRVSDPTDVVITLGAQGVWYQGDTYPTPAATVYDVCGAGDTFLSALGVYHVAHGGHMHAAIQFAQQAAAVTIRKVGVYAPTWEEILNETGR
jgi:bifunctional ADP-heptose synthase (sugar kinase/adenylyltransferase)